MSHVIGQGTIASNHYRTSEYRASQYETPQVFNSEQTDFNSSVATKSRAAAKQFADVVAGLRKKIIDGETVSKSVKKMLDTFGDDELFDRFETFFKNSKQGTPDPDDVKWMRKLLKSPPEPLNSRELARMTDSLSGAKATDEWVDAALNKESIKKATDAAGDLVKNAPMGPFKARVTNGGILIVGSVAIIGAVMGFGGNEFLQKWMDNKTGNDCGPKADDQNLDDEEYSAAVAACQQGALDSLTKLGYGALAIVGFIGLVAVTRAIPKRKAKKEPEEDEDAPEDEE
jgi:hypothetical protein